MLAKMPSGAENHFTTERSRPIWADAETQRLLAEARDVLATGDVDKIAEWLSAGDETMVEELAADLIELQGANPEVARAALQRLEDQELLSDSRLQESLRQMHAGELIDITPSDDDSVPKLH